MTNKIKQKNLFKKKLKLITIIYSIFAIVILTLTLFKKYSIISSNFPLIFIYIIIATIFLLTIVILCSKSFSSKEINTSLCINLVGIALLTTFGITIDVRKELIDFSKNATKTDAFVYKDVEKEITKHEKDNCNGGYRDGIYCVVGNYKHYYETETYYEVRYTYHLKYNVNNETYTTTYSKKEGGSFSNEQKANSNKSKYKKGDHLTIYYDNNNPEDVRENFALGFGMIYFFEVVAILFQLFYFTKQRKLMKEVLK